MSSTNKLAALNATPCMIAKDLDFSENAILHCYEDGMSAGDLVMNILNLQDNDPIFKIYCNITSCEETHTLWKEQQCKKCFNQKASCISLPCCHLVFCKHCRSERCIICSRCITDWIHVYV